MRFATASLILAYVATISVHALALPTTNANGLEQRSPKVAGALEARIKGPFEVRDVSEFVKLLLLLE